MRVLVVDDDGDIAAMLARVVAHLGHRAVTCTNPTEAIEVHSFDYFDAVVSDFMMHPDGIEVLRAFTGQSCKRVLLTASYGTAEIRNALLDGTVHVVLTKPATIAELRNALSGVVVLG